MTQKTMTDLLGPYNAATDEVSGRFIVRRDGTIRVATGAGTFECEGYRVLWSFDGDFKARAAFAYWQRGE